MTERIYIYDTTLRDGAQTEGISFSLGDKESIAGLLDSFGMDFIEGGMPASNPKDREFFSSERKMKRSSLVAFGSTCRPGHRASEDEGLKILAESKTEWACIFGKAWDFHVTEALNTTTGENLRMIRDSITYLKECGMKVIFDAEHFFDGYRANEKYALDVVKTAAESGAEWIVLCDTNGGSLPSFIGKVTGTVHRIFPKIGIHCHNDSDLAVACSLSAVENGATMIQGTVNGIGERCGNANLCSVIPDLVFKMGYEMDVNLTDLRSLSYAVSELANTRHLAHMPYVGDKAFTHKGGMHVSALLKNTATYEHVPPESVGNHRNIIVSDMAGKSNIQKKLSEMGVEVDEDGLRRVLARVKEMEAQGYQFDAADASLKLLVERVLDKESRPFDIRGFRLNIDGVGTTQLISEASIKIVDRLGEIEHTAADCEGPVNALDRALRKALSKFYPDIIKNVRLTDYKVRVIEENCGTESWVRVLIKSTDGKDTWTTIGVSENVVEASLIALADSYEYAIQASQ
jgi:2-isopropylmalate synthase